MPRLGLDGLRRTSTRIATGEAVNLRKDMRVLFVEPGCDRRGHYGLNDVNICQALAKHGHEVTLWTNKVYTEKYLHEPVLFKIVEVDNGRLTFDNYYSRGRLSPYRYARGCVRNSYAILNSALKAAKEMRFDVVHATGLEFTTSALLLKRHSKRIPPVVMEMMAANFSFSTYPGDVFMRSIKVIQRELFRTTLRKEIKAIAVLGEYHQDALRKQLRLPEEFPIRVIPDGGSVPTIRLDVGEARSRLGLGDYQGTLFLFFGLIRNDKGIEDLLKAVSLLNGRDCKLLIAGSPYHYSENQIADLIAANKISDKVLTRLAYIPEDEMPAYFYAADALVLPYPRIYRGGAGPLLKGAGFHRRPSIVTDVSEMGRLVKLHNMGLVAEPGNPESLAQKMQEFIETSATTRQQMAENAFAVAKENTWDAMAVKFTDLYQLALQ